MITLFIIISAFITIKYIIYNWEDWDNKDYFEEDFDEEHALDQVLNDMVEDLDEEETKKIPDDKWDSYSHLPNPKFYTEEWWKDDQAKK